MKVLLINPPTDPSSEGTYEKFMPHIGLGYLGAYLCQKGFNCEVLDAKFEGVDLGSVTGRIEALKPDVLGITMMTEEFRSASTTAKRVKEIDPDIVVIVGGPHPTALPTQTLLDEKNFDIAVYGEGEYTLYELLTVLNNGHRARLNEVQGIAYRLGDEVIQTSPRPWIEDLDKLPFPAWELFRVNKETRFIPMLTGRGCPYKCIFCMRVSGSRPRFRSVENVLEEVDRLVDRFNCRYLYFCDETFTMNRKRLFQLCNGFIERGYHKVLKWRCETRVSSVDQEMLHKMKEAGCDTVGFGIESGNDEILKVVNKGITTEQSINAVRWAKNASLTVETFFILGHPFETRETVNDTIRFAKQLNPDTAEFSIMTPLPGTELADMAERGEGGLRLLSKNYVNYSLQLSRSMELESLPLAELKRLQLKAYMTFYLRPGKFFTLFKLINVKRLPRILAHYLGQAIFRHRS